MTTQTQPAAAALTLRAAPALPALGANERSSLVSTISYNQSASLVAVLKSIESAEFAVNATSYKVGRLFHVTAVARASFPSSGGHTTGAIACPTGWFFQRAVEKASALRASGGAKMTPSWGYDTRGNTGTIEFRVVAREVPTAGVPAALEEGPGEGKP